MYWCRVVKTHFVNQIYSTSNRTGIIISWLVWTFYKFLQAYPTQVWLILAKVCPCERYLDLLSPIVNLYTFKFNNPILPINPASSDKIVLLRCGGTFVVDLCGSLITLTATMTKFFVRFMATSFAVFGIAMYAESFVDTGVIIVSFNVNVNNL